jgi:dTMP kinase
MFITFEGGEGSGKSTAIAKLAEKLRKEGYPIVLTREPGGTPIGEKIRAVILDRQNVAMDPKTEALLYAASRRQLVAELIVPALKRGDVVLCDRYLDSSLAYQGGARGLGIDNVLRMNLFATEGLEPDLTLLFDLDPEVGLRRIAGNAEREVNRLDVEQLAFHKKVRAAFLELAGRYPNRYAIIDASQDPERVLAIAYETIKARLKK